MKTNLTVTLWQFRTALLPSASVWNRIAHALPTYNIYADTRKRFHIFPIDLMAETKKSTHSCVIRMIYKCGRSGGCWLSAVNKIESTPPVLWRLPFHRSFRTCRIDALFTCSLIRISSSLYCGHRKYMSDIASIFICHPVVTRLRAAITFRFTLVLDVLRRNTCVVRISWSRLHCAIVFNFWCTCVVHNLTINYFLWNSVQFYDYCQSLKITTARIILQAIIVPLCAMQ